MGDVERSVAVWENTTAEALARQLDLPRVAVYDEVHSTMDIAHALGQEGSPAGTLVLADSQRAGRGRNARRWMSEPGGGIWMTLVERPQDPAAIDLLSLRVGIRLARALDRFVGVSDAPLQLKWPNDVLRRGRKVAGVLVEARWRDERIEWIAIGIGVNTAPPPAAVAAASLGDAEGHVRRLEVLAEMVPAVRAAAQARGLLSPHELHEFARRDAASGRRCLEPARGWVAGIAENGDLLVRDDATGSIQHCRSGSLVLEAPLA